MARSNSRPATAPQSTPGSARAPKTTDWPGAGGGSRRRTLLRFAYDVFDRGLDVVVGQARLPAASRHRALALDDAGNHCVGALLDPRRPRVLITDLRRHIVVAHGAVGVIDRLAVGKRRRRSRRDQDRRYDISAKGKFHGVLLGCPVPAGVSEFYSY